MRVSHSLLLTCVAVVWSVAIGAQVQPQSKTFVINGHNGDAMVARINGREYIDVEALVSITNGSMGVQNGATILTLPATQGGVASSSADPNRLSREFMKAGIEEITLLREWASPLATAIQNGFPVTESWVAGYREKAAGGLRSASAVTSTAADQSALALLSNEFNLVEQWSQKLLEARKSMSAGKYAVSPDALRNDPLSQQIIACAGFLGPILSGGTFQDDASCH